MAGRTLREWISYARETVALLVEVGGDSTAMPSGRQPGRVDRAEVQAAAARLRASQAEVDRLETARDDAQKECDRLAGEIEEFIEKFQEAVLERFGADSPQVARLAQLLDQDRPPGPKPPSPPQ